MESKNKELIKKIGEIQNQVKELVRDEKNKNLYYKYFEESQLLKVLKPLLKEKKLTMLITDDDTQPFQHEREKVISKSGNESTNHYIRYLKKMEIVDYESGQSLTFKFWACGDNTDLAKAKGSAETYAMKYILSKFFLMVVVDENDPELKENNNDLDKEVKVKELTPAELEKKQVMEMVFLKEDGWYYCRVCQVAGLEPFKLIKHQTGLKISELKDALIQHGEWKDK